MTAKIKPFLVAAVFLAAAASAFFQQRQIIHLRQQVDVAIAHPAANAKPSLNQLETSLQPMLTETDSDKRMKLFNDFAKSLDPAEAHALLDYLAKMKSSDEIEFVELYLIPIWAEDDPAVVLAWGESHLKKPISPVFYFNLLGAWMDKDPDGALAALKEMVPDAPKERSDILSRALNLLAGKNPRRAFDLLSTLPLSEQQSDYDSVFGVWTSSDPTAAAAAALNLPISDARDRTLNLIGQIWADVDGPTALAWADNLPSGNPRTEALNGVLASLEETDPKSAMAYIASLPAGSQRDDLITKMLGTYQNSLIETDPSAVLAWVDDTATIQTRDKLAAKILSQISSSGDPADAVAYLAHTPDATIRDATIPAVAAGMAMQDVNTALAWVQSLPDSDGATRQEAMESVVGAWAQYDPAAAVAYIQQNLSDDPNESKIITHAMDDLTTLDPQSAIALAKTLSDGPLQDAALSKAISDYAKADPSGAWDDAQQLPAGDNQVQTLSNVIAAWSYLDPVKAVSLLDNLPAGTPQDAATLKVTDNWFKHDPAAEIQWFNTLPPGSTRDHAVRGQVSYMTKTDLPGAFALAASVGDATIRNRQLRAVIQAWAKKDPAAALNALQTITLTAQQMTTLTNLIQNQTPGN